MFATTRGNCSSGYSVPFTVTGGGWMVGSNGAGAWSGIISGDRCTRNGAPSLGGLSRKVAVMAYSSES